MALYNMVVFKLGRIKNSVLDSERFGVVGEK